MRPAWFHQRRVNDFRDSMNVPGTTKFEVLRARQNPNEYGTPGMGLDLVEKIFLPLFQGQFAGAAIKMLRDPAYGARIGFNGLLTFALEFEESQVTLIKFIKSVRLSFFHGIPPIVLMAPGIGSRKEKRENQS
jgi:hypothetical protein